MKKYEKLCFQRNYCTDATGHGVHNIVFLVSTVQKEKLSKKGRDKGEGRERIRRDTDREWLIYTGILKF